MPVTTPLVNAIGYATRIANFKAEEGSYIREFEYNFRCLKQFFSKVAVGFFS